MKLTRVLFPASVSLGLALGLSVAAPAQMQVFGGPGERAASTVIFFDRATESMAGIAIQYGQPQWKAEYDGMADKAAGQRLRLGKDWWTTFDNSVAIELGGVKIPAGSWFVGLEGKTDGKFELLLIDSKQAMKTNQMPFVTEAWKVDHSIPVKFEKGALDETVDDLTIELKAGGAEPTALTLSVTWGTHRLSATGKATVGARGEHGHGEHDGAKKAGEKKDAKEAKKEGKS